MGVYASRAHRGSIRIAGAEGSIRVASAEGSIRIDQIFAGSEGSIRIDQMITKFTRIMQIKQID